MDTPEADYAVDGDDGPTVFVGDKTGQRSVDGWAQSADPLPPLWVESGHSCCPPLTAGLGGWRRFRFCWRSLLSVCQCGARLP